MGAGRLRPLPARRRTDGDRPSYGKPLARVATTFRVLEASVVGWARRPAWANSVAAKHAAQSENTRARHPASDRIVFTFRGLLFRSACIISSSPAVVNPILFSFQQSLLAWFFRLSAPTLAQMLPFPLFRRHCPGARSRSHTNLRL